MRGYCAENARKIRGKYAKSACSADAYSPCVSLRDFSQAQKSASHNHKSERNFFWHVDKLTWTYGCTDLAVFVPLVTHFPCENSILLDFSIRRVPTTLGCESHSQAGLASPHHQLPRVVSFSRIIIDMLQSYMIWLVSVRSQEFLGVKAFRSPLQWWVECLNTVHCSHQLFF